jgi:CBS domain-containing protein
MQVTDIMTTDCITIKPDANIKEVAQAMRTRDTGMIPVLDNNRVVGVVTDRDIVVRALAEGANPEITNARKVMTPDITFGYTDQSVSDVSELMKRNRIRRLVILNRKNNQFVGVCSLGDIARKGDNSSKPGDVVREVSRSG